MVSRITKLPTEPNKEAEKFMKKGKKAIATSFFKWSPDWFEGSTQFNKAAKLFKVSGHKEQAIEAFLQHSECSAKADETTGAAEGLKEAAFLTDDYEKDTFPSKAHQNG